MQPSRNVISALTDVRHLGPDDGLSDSLVTRDSHLVYKGDAFVHDGENNVWVKSGWARILLRGRGGQDLLEGAFSVDGEYHHISLGSNLRKHLDDNIALDGESPSMVVWKETEPDRTIFERSSSNESSCAAETFGSGPLDLRAEGGGSRQHAYRSTFRRQNNWFNPVDTIGSTDGCPSRRLVAMLGIATDCTYTAEFDSLEDARANVISQVNIASQVYEDTFNISLAIRNLTISDSSCPSTSSVAWNVPCSGDLDISRRLTLFSQWRGRFPDDGNAAWTLLSGCSSGSTVGMAWIGNTCGRGSTWRGGSTVASTNVVIRTESEWQVIAHELAHNFGANHDCTSSTCSGNNAQDCCPLSESTCDANGQYLMNPSSDRQLRDFSPCTIGAICTAIGRDLIDTSCLVSEDDPVINDSQCGNGIVEPGEACDCGGDQCPEDSCCNPSTCQLRSGAECDPTSDGCCTDQCRVADSGQICRASTGPCDPEETCDGTSSQCPEDVQDTESDSCGGGSGDNGGGNSGGGSRGSDWFDDNRTVVIAVASSVGGLIAVLILICIVTSCVRKRKGGKRLQKNNSPLEESGTGPPMMAAQVQMPTSPRMVHRYA
ncbi:hypothetical protein ACJ41O_006394 [Fusarium nematophilum]